VLSYDNEQRKGLLENLSAFFKNNLIWVLSLMGAVIAIIISIAFLFVRSQSKITAIDQRFMTLQKILYKSGVPINPTLGPSDYIDGAIKTSPHLKSLLLQFKSLYIQLQYAEVNDVKSKELQHKIGRLSSLIKKMIRQHKGI
jgi:hypothetical protein